MPAEPERAALPYRDNVGIVLVNGAGLVFTARRHDIPDAWQMPQGGIDAGEAPLGAALRELAEETGVTQASLLAQTEDWLHYDFPDWIFRRSNRRYRGQRQKWFCLRLDAGDETIDLNAHVDPRTGRPEFTAWRWSDRRQVLADIIDFKRDVYSQVLARFDQFLAP